MNHLPKTDSKEAYEAALTRKIRLCLLWNFTIVRSLFSGCSDISCRRSFRVCLLELDQNDEICQKCWYHPRQKGFVPSEKVLSIKPIKFLQSFDFEVQFGIIQKPIFIYLSVLNHLNQIKVINYRVLLTFQSWKLFSFEKFSALKSC